MTKRIRINTKTAFANHFIWNLAFTGISIKQQAFVKCDLWSEANSNGIQ